jgi:hypothetical protein
MPALPRWEGGGAGRGCDAAGVGFASTLSYLIHPGRTTRTSTRAPLSSDILLSVPTFLPRTTLCLALGFLTTIAIAWTSAAVNQPRFMRVRGLATAHVHSDLCEGHLYFNRAAQRARLLLRAHPLWDNHTIPRPMSPDEVRRALDHFEQRAKSQTLGFPRPWGRMPQGPQPSSSGRQINDPQWIQDARGWPMPALWCEWTNVHLDPPPFQAEGGFDLPAFTGAVPENTLRALPYRPIPLGLTLDTLLFATVWSLLLFIPIPLRAHLRRARNLCPRCAYPLSNLPPNSLCSEFGARFPSVLLW